MPLTEFDQLPPLARTKRYRALAEDARRDASGVAGSVRESYLLSAEKWDKLAVEVERDADRDNPNSDPKK